MSELQCIECGKLTPISKLSCPCGCEPLQHLDVTGNNFAICDDCWSRLGWERIEAKYGDHKPALGVDRQLSKQMRKAGFPVDTYADVVKELELYIKQLEKQLVAKEQAIQILMDRVNVLKFEVANKK